MPPARPRLRPRLAFAAATALAALALAEFVLRAAGLEPSGWFVWIPPSLFAESGVAAGEPGDPRVFFRPDSDTILSPRPGLDLLVPSPVHPSLAFRVRTDRRGLRVVPPVDGASAGPPPPGAPAGAGDVIVLGDSKAFGWGVDDGEALPARLQHHLGVGDGSATATRVVNAGLPSGEIVQGEALLRARFPAVRRGEVPVRALVLWFCGDNAGEAPLGDAELIERLGEPSQRLARWAVEHSALYSALAALGSPAPLLLERLGRSELVPRVTGADYERILGELARDLAPRGTRVLVVNRPPRRGDAEDEAAMARWNAVLERAATALDGLELVDLRERLPTAMATPEAGDRLGERYGEAYTTLDAEVWRGRPENRGLVDGPIHLNAVGLDVVAREVAAALTRPAPRPGGGREAAAP